MTMNPSSRTAPGLLRLASAAAFALTSMLAPMLALVLAAPARADAGPAVWACWLHEDTDLACLALREARPEGRSTSGGASPRSAYGQAVYIPLHTVPFDDSSVAQLAHAVLCGARPACNTRYAPELAGLIAQSPADFDADAAADPVLAGGPR